jgi:hypothetical protein
MVGVDPEDEEHDTHYKENEREYFRHDIDKVLITVATRVTEAGSNRDATRIGPTLSLL